MFVKGLHWKWGFQHSADLTQDPLGFSESMQYLLQNKLLWSIRNLMFDNLLKTSIYTINQSINQSINQYSFI